MAIPSVGGTEVLKYHQVKTVSDSNVLLIPSPTANHIYTVLSIIFTEEGGHTSSIIYLRTFTDSGMSANEHWLLRDGSGVILSRETFIWSDRFSFSGVLYLAARTAASSNIDIHTTYIDQNWE